MAICGRFILHAVGPRKNIFFCHLRGILLANLVFSSALSTFLQSRNFCLVRNNKKTILQSKSVEKKKTTLRNIVSYRNKYSSSLAYVQSKRTSAHDCLSWTRTKTTYPFHPFRLTLTDNTSFTKKKKKIDATEFFLVKSTRNNLAIRSFVCRNAKNKKKNETGPQLLWRPEVSVTTRYWRSVPYPLAVFL